MRMIACFIVLGLLLAISGCKLSGGSSSTTTYTPTDGSYSISFPGKPVEKTITAQTAIGPITAVMATYSPVLSKRQFLSSSTKYPVASNQYDVQKGLDGARDGAAKNTNGTVTSETKIDHNGVAGREFETTVPGGGKTKSRLFIDNAGPNPILYQAVVTDAGGDISGSEIESFLTSLQFKSK